MPWSYSGQRQGGEGLPFILTRVEGPTGLYADVQAMIDTGADQTCLSASVAASLGIAANGKTYQQSQVSTNSTAQSADVRFHLINTNITPNVGFQVDTDVALINNMFCSLILGWHCLKYFDLSFSRSGSFTISRP